MFTDIQSGSTDFSLDLAMVQAIVNGDARPSWICTARGHLIWANEAAQMHLELPWARLSQMLPWVLIVDSAKGLIPLTVQVPQGLSYDVMLLPNPVGGSGALYLVRPSRAMPESIRTGQFDESTVESDRLTRLSHDLRVPLQSLMIACDSFDTQINKEQHIQQIKVVTKLALDQVSYLLEERARSHKELQSVIDFDINSLIFDIVSILNPICSRNNNKIVIDGAQKPTWFKGDPRPIRSILQNLISNSNRFSQDSEIKLRLRHFADPKLQKDQVILEIEDQGPGLSAEQKANLSDPDYWRNPNKLKRDIAIGGYGIGMQIVSQAVANLGGQLTISNGENSGAIFRIAFELTPLAQVVAPTEENDVETLAGMRVLLVEDNVISASILSRMMENSNAKVDVAHCGRDALNSLGNPDNRFDVVLLDVSLPDIDGIEVARRSREIAQRQKTALIGLTAHEDTAIHHACLAAGMELVLLKPVRPKDLRRLLKSRMSVDETDQNPVEDVQTFNTPQEILDDAVVSGLIDELGKDSAVAFLRKALQESADLAVQCRAGMDVLELRKCLHSAIGSAGLTGLKAVEESLRLLQDAVRENRNRTQVFLRFEMVLALSEQKIAQL